MVVPVSVVLDHLGGLEKQVLRINAAVQIEVPSMLDGSAHEVPLSCR